MFYGVTWQSNQPSRKMKLLEEQILKVKMFKMILTVEAALDARGCCVKQ